MSKQIAPVTPILAKAMESAYDMFAKVQRGDRKFNDKSVYVELANQLEALTINVLGAASSLSFLGTKPAGARFDMGSDTTLARHVSRCVTYLRGPATELIQAGSFSQYEQANAEQVLSKLETLYVTLTSAIRTEANEDIDTVIGNGPAYLIVMAEYVAQQARKKNEAPEPTAPDWDPAG